MKHISLKSVRVCAFIFFASLLSVAQAEPQNGALATAYYTAATGFLGLNSSELALEYFQKSADLGHTGAMRYLGNFYSSKKTNPENLKLALKYYQMAINMGDAESAYELALLALKGEIVMLKNGKPTPTSRKEAASFYFAVAARLGDPRAAPLLESLITKTQPAENEVLTHNEF